MLTQFNTYG